MKPKKLKKDDQSDILSEKNAKADEEDDELEMISGPEQADIEKIKKIEPLLVSIKVEYDEKIKKEYPNIEETDFLV